MKSILQCIWKLCSHLPPTFASKPDEAIKNEQFSLEAVAADPFDQNYSALVATINLKREVFLGDEPVVLTFWQSFYLGITELCRNVPSYINCELFPLYSLHPLSEPHNIQHVQKKMENIKKRIWTSSWSYGGTQAIIVHGKEWVMLNLGGDVISITLLGF